MTSAEKTSPKSTRTGRDRPLVLMVDDDEDFQTVMREWLQDTFDTVSLTDGGEFLETVVESDPDVIVLDVELPGPDGFRLCRVLQRYERLRKIPVLFLTGRASDEDFLRNLDSGGSAFLTKPVDPEELKRHLETLLGG